MHGSQNNSITLLSTDRKGLKGIFNCVMSFPVELNFRILCVVFKKLKFCIGVVKDTQGLD